MKGNRDLDRSQTRCEMAGMNRHLLDDKAADGLTDFGQLPDRQLTEVGGIIDLL
jgi:hypothetical protein